MSIFQSRFVPSWRNPVSTVSIDSPFLQAISQPSWCTGVLLRAWDDYSYSQMPLLPNAGSDPQRGDGFESSAFENDDVLEQELNTFDKRAVALTAHATYKHYNVCFVSMQMDWNALMVQARKRNTRRGGRGYTYITAIDAQKLAQKPWKLLRMADELEAGDLRFEHYIAGEPWRHEYYRDEVLAIHRIPRDCVLGTFRLEDKDNWQMGATTWRDEVFVPQLNEKLGLSSLPKGFAPELFKRS